MSEIQLKNISKHFPGATAVKQADFTIHDGEFFILVGPSGCGKSTLLNMIVGLEDVSTGEILIDGQRVNDLDPKDRNMAMVFQSYAIYPHMTVRDNIAFPLKLTGMSRQTIDERVMKAAEILELENLLDRKPRALSGGQRQRVAMGRAIVRNPKAFLLDEPLSNLDAKLRVQMRTEIARLQKHLGTTTIYVTHDQTEAMTLGDRIAVMNKGEVQQIGTPQELYEYPANLFVASFIGSPAMNLLPARHDNGSLIFPLGRIKLPAKQELPPDPLVVGFRPEHLQLVRSEKKEGLYFDARVEVMEWLGADIFVYFDVPMNDFKGMTLPSGLNINSGDRIFHGLVARINPENNINEGDMLRLYLSPDHVQVFNVNNGRNLILSDKTT